MHKRVNAMFLALDEPHFPDGLSLSTQNGHKTWKEEHRRSRRACKKSKGASCDVHLQLQELDLRDLRVDRHDGRIPRKLYGYMLHGRRLRKRKDGRTKRVLKHINRHMKMLHSNCPSKYESMMPFNSRTGGREDYDSCVHLELGLCYKVKKHPDGTMQTILLSTFFTPLNFYNLKSKVIIW